MELRLRSLDAAGYKNQPVPNTFIVQPRAARHLGIVLPGYRYSPEMAPLYYAGRILLDQGADLLRIEYAYYRTNFRKQPQSEQDNWLSSDVSAVCEAALSHRSYDKITLIGKSMGTIAMGQLLADPRFQSAACVWLTPLLTLERLCSRIEQIHPPSLFIIGSADQFFKPDILEHLRQVTDGQSLILEGANHGLEIQDDIPKSLAALSQIVQALQEFLREAGGKT
jgi:hypothetical protein